MVGALEEFKYDRTDNISLTWKSPDLYSEGSVIID
jgi:hypothetical protein